MSDFEKLIILSMNRIEFLFEGDNDFYNGSGTYFSALIEEIAEATYENKENNKVYLEDELGDIFWDYICVLSSLKKEGKIDSVESILKRSYKKFSTRVGIDGKGTGIPWDETKKKQKQELKKEHYALYGK